MVVDVLSFTTTLSVAVDAGTAVLPYPFARDDAAAFAEAHDAVLAGPRSSPGPSLSPASLRASTPPARLVLPSPNGATISYALGGTCLGGSLRNAASVATWIAGRHAPADISELLLGSVTGRELTDAGFRDDVVIAAEVNSSQSVPLLHNGVFENAWGLDNPPV